MNTFNRVLLILLMLLLIVLLIITAVVPFTVLERLIYTLQLGQASLQARWPWSYLIFLGVDIVIILLAIFVLWLEVRPQAKKTLTVRTISGTQAEVATASVQQALVQEISNVPDVHKVRPVVSGKGGGVDVILDLETPAGIDIPSKVDEVSRTARGLVEERMGLRVAKIKVLLKHGPYGKAPSAAPAPSYAPGPAVEPAEPEPQAPQNQAGGTEPYGQL